MIIHKGSKRFLSKLYGKNPLFICVIGNTETAKIPGISAAGANPELTDYTPPADAEYLFYGKCRCIPGVPITPEGIPTPALITRSALKIAGIQKIVVNAGLRIPPKIPFIDVQGSPGGNIRKGKALDGRRVEEILENARTAGQILSGFADYLVIGESIAGGTTTALGVMLSMGINAEGKVSSSMPENPHDIKIRVVAEGMRKAGIKKGSCADDPVRAISCVGDPMIPAFSGIVLGAKVPVLLAGGTQMGAVLAVVKALSSIKNLCVATTRWILQDKQADLLGIIQQVGRIPVAGADIDFSSSPEGLREYERGAVKEGVGAGGAVISAILKGANMERMVRDIEREYRRLRNA